MEQSNEIDLNEIADAIREVAWAINNSNPSMAISELATQIGYSSDALDSIGTGIYELAYEISQLRKKK